MDFQTGGGGGAHSSGPCTVAYVGDKDGDLRVVDLRVGKAVTAAVDLHHK